MGDTYAVFYSLEEMDGKTQWYGTRDGNVVPIDSSPDDDLFYRDKYPYTVFSGGFVSIRSRQPVATAFDADIASWMYLARQRGKAELEGFCRNFFIKVGAGFIVDPRYPIALGPTIKFVKPAGKPQLSNAKWNELLRRISAVLADYVDRA